MQPHLRRFTPLDGTRRNIRMSRGDAGAAEPTDLSASPALTRRGPVRGGERAVRESGVVAIVVVIAIRTIMANSGGEITPMSRPMLSTINSIRPRVFISTPSRRGGPPVETGPAARHDRPPRTCRAPPRDDDAADDPVHRRREQADLRPHPGVGKEQRQEQDRHHVFQTVPERRATSAVMRDDRTEKERAENGVDPDRLRDGSDRPGRRRGAARSGRSSGAAAPGAEPRLASGRATSSITPTYPMASVTVVTAVPSSALVTPTTKASRHHAVTSSTATHPRDRDPSSDYLHLLVGQDPGQDRERRDRHRGPPGTGRSS